MRESSAMVSPIPLVRSRSGTACLWEAGGAGRNTGHAVVIAGPHGERLRAIYVRRRGPLAGWDHALIPVRVGDLVFAADQHREDFEITVSRIAAIRETEADLERLTDYEGGEWALPPLREWDGALQAVVAKATCYHCRAPHFVLEPEGGVVDAWV